MVVCGATLATAATAGQVGARSSPELNAESDLSPIPAASTTAELEEIVVNADPLAYVDDDGSDRSLEEYGAEIASTPTDEDGEPEPHNPFTLRADRIDTSEFTDFPRGETYNDGDDEDAPVSALDAEHWTPDAEVTVSDESPASGGSGLRFTSDGVAADTEAAATFTHVDIDSGVPRKEFQLVLSIEQLDGTAEIRAGDGTNWAVATIDAAADPDADGTVATSTEDGVVFQASVGDLDDTLEMISTVEIAAVDGDVDLLLAGMNLDRESSWSFGSREVWDDEEEEIETEEFVEPIGEFSLSSFEIDSVLEGEIDPLFVDVEYWPTSTDYTTGDPSNPAYDERLEIVDNIEIPSAYAISHGPIDIELELGMSPDQWSELETAEGLSETIVLGDRDDETFTDQSGDLDMAEVGDTIAIGSGTSGEIVAISQSLDVTSDQLEEIESGAVAGFFSGGGGGGFLSTPLGVITTVGSGIAAYVAIARGWVGRVLGGS